MSQEEKLRIIKIDEVEDKKTIKKLEPDKMFKFECENKNEVLKISLKEINVYSPYYYEAFYTKDNLFKKNDIFKSVKNIDKIIEQLLKLIEKNATLKKADDDDKIIISFQIPSFAETIDINFELEKKTIENKDDGLMFLYEIQRKNQDIIEEIKKLCKRKKNEQISKQITQIFANII